MNEEFTDWFERLSSGDEQAAHALWEAYFEKLVRLAKRKLDGVALRAADEEDVALSAMDSFYRGLTSKKFEEIADADSLWKLLVTITARKVCARKRLHFAQKRGAGRVRGESIFLHAGNDDSLQDGGIGDVLGNEPTPEFAHNVAENTRELIQSLEDETLKKIVLLTLEGYTNSEIAEKLGVVRRTIERKLKIVREIWEAREASMEAAENEAENIS